MACVDSKTRPGEITCQRVGWVNYFGLTGCACWVKLFLQAFSGEVIRICSEFDPAQLTGLCACIFEHVFVRLHARML